MNPTQPQSKSDGFVTKWRIFPPQSTVWVHNPFEHDVVFGVANEHNVQYQYTMPAGKTSELPGGAIATLGVKAIVDELIQREPKDLLSMWEFGVREKWEKTIILRYKEAPEKVVDVHTGKVNLGVDDVESDEEESALVVDEKPIFPTNDADDRDFIANVAANSLPVNNTVLSED